MNAIEWTFQLRFAVALGLGFLVGLERESAKLEQRHLVFGGVRTHPLISLFGFGCAWLYQVGLDLVLPAGLLALGGLAAIAYVTKVRAGHHGLTSEVSALLTFVTGALALLVDIWASMAVGIVNAFLLSEKAQLEAFVERLSRAEFLAVLKFLIISVIILPVLPDQEYTTYRLNPARIWQVVILVSTIGFVGYVLVKKFGGRVGMWLSGFLGGIVSSTAVTIAAGRMARREPGKRAAALQAALLAGSVMYIRILVLVAVLAPVYLQPLWWRMVLLATVGALLAISVRPEAGAPVGVEAPKLQNPFEITPAFLFAAVFLGLLVITEIVRDALGETGTIALSLVVGIADVDPFILSMLRLPTPSGSLVVMAILLASMSNTIAKGFYFGALVREARAGTAWRYLLWGAVHLPLAVTV